MAAEESELPPGHRCVVEAILRQRDRPLRLALYGDWELAERLSRLIAVELERRAKPQRSQR